MKSLKEHTRGLLLASDLTDRQVAEAMQCSITWVTMFRDGRIKSPNVDVIQRLYEHLAGEPLLKV